MEGTPYNISDAARVLAVEDHALRYWEAQLGLEIPRNAQGHRCYEEEQLTLFAQVKHLKEKGFTLKQIKAVLPKIEQVSRLEEDKLIALRKQLETLLGSEETTEMVCAAPKEKECVVEQTQKSKLEEFKELMGQLMFEALKKNNEALSESIQGMVSERLVKEMNYLFKEKEEQEEERYRKLDRTIREYQHARQRTAAAAEKRR